MIYAYKNLFPWLERGKKAKAKNWKDKIYDGLISFSTITLSYTQSGRVSSYNNNNNNFDEYFLNLFEK